MDDLLSDDWCVDLPASVLGWATSCSPSSCGGENPLPSAELGTEYWIAAED